MSKSTLLFGALLLTLPVFAQPQDSLAQKMLFQQEANEAALKICTCSRPIVQLSSEMDLIKDKPEEIMKRMEEFQKTADNFKVCVKPIETEYAHRKEDQNFSRAVQKIMETQCKDVTDIMSKQANAAQQDESAQQQADSLAFAAQVGVETDTPKTKANENPDKTTQKEAKAAAKMLCSCAKPMLKLTEKMDKIKDKPKEMEANTTALAAASTAFEICILEVETTYAARKNDKTFEAEIKKQMEKQCKSVSKALNNLQKQ